MRHPITMMMFIVLAWLWISPRASGQTPIVAPGAMQPSTGTGVVHVMPMYRHERDDPITNQQSADEYAVITQVAYGLASNLGIQLDIPTVYSDIENRDGSSEDQFGLADSTLLLKWRVYQEDPAPAETMRFSLIGGVQIPGNVDGWDWDSADGFNPIIGAVFSTVRGRHGFNASALWEFYTGLGSDDEDERNRGDALRADMSYLFRLAPAQYAADTTGAWYAVAELNFFYDTNGDRSLFLSPGLMFEARSYTLDASIMIPVYQDVQYRAEVDIALAIGIRISF